MVELSIIIPTYNRNINTNNCIKSILSCKIPNLEIIIINDYADGSFTLDHSNDLSEIIILNNPKKGVASARNFGAKIAKGRILLFIDDDMIITKKALINVTNFININNNSTYNANWEYPAELIAAIEMTQFGRYLIKNNFTSLKGWNHGSLEWKKDSFLQTNIITSQFWGIKKQDFEKTGGYNETFPFAGFEDYDISVKLKKNDLKIFIDTSVLIYHNENDRVEPVKWLQRKERGAFSRKVAVEIGFKELEIKYSRLKQLMYKALTQSEALIFIFLRLIPNIPYLDFLYHKTINLLLGTYIYKGYNQTAFPKK